VKNPDKKFFRGSRGAVFQKSPPGRRRQEKGAADQMKRKKTRYRDKQIEKRVNPYKGLKSYEEGDSGKFYGRNQETYNLFHQVKFNFLTVVFGKAGIGKTSLLNAGVFPLLRDSGFLPIRLRLNYAKGAPPLLEQIHRGLLEEIRDKEIQVRKLDGNEAAEPMAAGESLWEYLHRTTHFHSAGKKIVTPVLVLDQFEEVFTLGKKHKDREALLDELYWLIENQLPGFLRERLLKGEREFPFSVDRPNARLIISLREDYVPHLIQLKSRIPSIDRVMSRVVHLHGEQAREVMGMPGGIGDPQVARDILRRFYPEGTPGEETIPDEKLEIEPAFLSLLCYQLVEEQGLRPIIKEELDRVLVDFYDLVMKPYPAELKKFIESRLLTEGGFRTPFYLEPGHRQRAAIGELVNRRVLRRFHDGDREYIEIIHDVLAPVIHEKRNRRSKKAKNMIIGILSMLLLCFAGLTFYAFQQKNRADDQYKKVKILLLTAEAFLEIPRDNMKAIRMAEAAYRMGLPDPPARTCQALSEAGYSFYNEPYYTVSLGHAGAVTSAVFSPDGTRILTASRDGHRFV
jgi:cbb3-type cytochrome oxidase subunit 3